MAETKQTVDKKQDTRKTAPNIVVAENYGKRPIDQLLADNPGEAFVRVPEGSSEQALANRGLEPVKVGGQVLTRKGYVVARCIDETHEREIEEQHEEAEDTISAVRDLELSDMTAFKKAPKNKKKRSSKK